jgi:hypothetical protein
MPDGAEPCVAEGDKVDIAVIPPSGSKEDTIVDVVLNGAGHDRTKTATTSSPIAHEDDRPTEEVVEEGKKEVKEAEERNEMEEGADRPLPPGAWLYLGFTYFWALVFGGCDFYTVDMVREAGGLEGGIDVAMHLFVPMGIATMITVPVVGELLDRYPCGIAVMSMCVGFAGLGACITANLFVVATRPAVAVSMAPPPWFHRWRLRNPHPIRACLYRTRGEPCQPRRCLGDQLAPRFVWNWHRTAIVRRLPGHARRLPVVAACYEHTSSSHRIAADLSRFPRRALASTT